MGENTHTPLPWVANGRYIGTRNHMSYVGEVRDENGNWSDTVKSRGDASFIVEACNSYYGNKDALAAKDAEIDRLREVIAYTRSLVSVAAMVGFNYQDGDWAERLFLNQAKLSAALKGGANA